MWDSSRVGSLGEFLLGNLPLRFVGRISYSIYLYHLPLLLLWNKFAPGLGWWTLSIYVAIDSRSAGVPTASSNFGI
jgi:peptidoglycan/LPS O-acetylase OafA/YrhL